MKLPGLEDTAPCFKDKTSTVWATALPTAQMDVWMVDSQARFSACITNLLIQGRALTFNGKTLKYLTAASIASDGPRFDGILPQEKALPRINKFEW